jgi:plastocyanin
MFRRSASPLVARSLRSFAVAGAGLALVGLTACGGGGSSSAATVPADAGLVVKAVGTIAWDAKSYEATATNGTLTIALKNESSLAHNLYVLDSSNTANSKHLEVVSNGDVDSGTFELAPGTYSIVCRVPGHGAMNSTLTVK